MIPPDTAATPWPVPLSPRLHEVVELELELALARREHERQVKLDRLARYTPPTPTADVWQPQELGDGIRVWRPVTWMRWTLLDLAVAIIALTLLSAHGHITRQPWYTELLVWLALHEPQSWHESPAPGWTVHTAELHAVVRTWEAAHVAARIGAGR